MSGDRYFDDNCWTGSDLLQHYLLTEESVALDRAERVFSYIQTGWDTSSPKPGGVRWVDASFNGDRAANSTGGWAKLGAHLYEATGRRTEPYLEWASKAYAWAKEYLLLPGGLYANAIRADGSIDPTLWIYNQGIVIGAGALLHRVTGEAAYRADAERLAAATLAHFGTDAYYSGTTGAYSGRAIFNAIFFRNLLMLYAVNRDVEYVQKMQVYADAVWVDPALHDRRRGLFRLNGESRDSLLDQAAMVQVYAALSWDPDRHELLA
jgi:predicted alpha-1,6-mannanase (GH76 family)